MMPDGSVQIRGKNANRDGSLYAIQGGSWRATFYDSTGKLRTVRGRTRAEAVERRTAKLAENDRAALSSFRASTTLAELAEWWLTNIAAQRVRPSSLGQYRDRVARINAGLGATAVMDLRAEMVASWLATLGRDGLSTGTIRDTRAVLRQIIETAVDLGLVPTNVTAKVRPPKVTRKEGRALSVEDTRRLLAAASDDRLAAAVGLLFVQGWRVSEVLGLAWEDLDLDAGRATIRRAAVYVDGQGAVLGPPKTAGARGEHRLSPGVVELLQRHRSRQAEERDKAGDVWQTQYHEGRAVSLVFTNQTGGLVLRQSVTKAVKRAAAAAGLDPAEVSTHTGRRSVVTALYAVEGIDLDDIARHVGH